MLNIKNFIKIVITTILLVACGGGSGGGWRRWLAPRPRRFGWPHRRRACWVSRIKFGAPQQPRRPRADPRVQLEASRIG